MSQGGDRTAVETPTDAEHEASTKRPAASRAKRVLYLVFAGIFFALGVLGALLPGLPATPFLLLTGFFLARSSPRLHSALLRSRLLGPILVDWQVHGGVQTHVKVKAIILVAAAVAVTIIAADASLIPTLIITSLAAVGIVVILRLPAAKAPNRPRVKD